MALKDYFPGNNEKKILVERLSKVTLTSKSTVYKWLSGEVVPPPLKQKIIAEELGEPINKLFPNNV